MSWFKRKTVEKVLPDHPVEYPSGTAVSTPSGLWYIKGAFKHSMTDLVKDSWNFRTIVETSDEAISKYLKGRGLGFRDGTLVYDFSTGSTYIISDGKRRHVVDPRVLEGMGWDFRNDAIWASRDEVNRHAEGEVIKWQ